MASKQKKRKTTHQEQETLPAVPSGSEVQILGVAAPNLAHRGDRDRIGIEIVTAIIRAELADDILASANFRGYTSNAISIAHVMTPGFGVKDCDIPMSDDSFATMGRQIGLSLRLRHYFGGSTYPSDLPYTTKLTDDRCVDTFLKFIRFLHLGQHTAEYIMSFPRDVLEKMRLVTNEYDLDYIEKEYQISADERVRFWGSYYNSQRARYMVPKKMYFATDPMREAVRRLSVLTKKE